MPCCRSTRAERIEREELIDVCEWSELRGQVWMFPLPAAFTQALWDLTTIRPFGVESDAVERIGTVLCTAERALLRATKPPLLLDPRIGFVVSFGVALPCRASRPRWRPLGLLCRPEDGGETVATIGLAEELKSVPWLCRA